MARPGLLLTTLVATGSLFVAAQQPARPKLEAPADGPLLEAIPTGALAFVETKGLGSLFTALRDSRAVATITESEQFGAFEDSEEFGKLQDGLGLAEFVLRMNLWEAGEKLLGGRAALALYPVEGSEKPDSVFILRPADPEAWRKQRIWTDPLLGLSAERLDRKRFTSGMKVYQTKGKGEAPAYVALHPHWLAVATDRDLLEQTIALQIAQPEVHRLWNLPEAKSLSGDEAFQTMAKRVGHDHLARLLVDTGTISQATGGRLGLPEKMDNPLGSLLLGGILEMAAHSTIGTLTIDAKGDELVVEAGFDGDPARLPEHYQVFFSKADGSGARPLPEVPGLIGGFSMHRDIASWYRSRDELIIESVLPEFDKFETGVGNLLPGKDVGEDVFPLLGDHLTFLGAIQDYDHLSGAPGVQLPGFAFVIDLDEAQEGSDIFQLFFQTLLSVLNIEAGKQNRQPWIMDVKMHGEVKINTARYLETPDGDDLPIVFNFLPASARVGDRFIVSSSLQLCEHLVDALSQPAPEPAGGRDLLFEIRLRQLAEILAANTSHFEAKRVSEGRTVAQARADVALFLSLLRELDTFSVSNSSSDDGIRLRLAASAASHD